MLEVSRQPAPPLVIEVDLRPEDVRRVATRGLWAAGIVPMLALFCTSSVGALWAARRLGAVPVLVGLPLVIGAAVWLWRWNARRTHARLAEKRMLYRFTGEHVEIESGPSSGKLSWSHLLRWEEDRHAFYLFPQPNVAHVIPKRCVADAEVVRTRLAAVKPAHTTRRSRIALTIGMMWIVLLLAFVLIYNYVAAAR